MNLYCQLLEICEKIVRSYVQAKDINSLGNPKNIAQTDTVCDDWNVNIGFTCF